MSPANAVVVCCDGGGGGGGGGGGSGPVAADPLITPNPIDFGVVHVGTLLQQTLTVLNQFIQSDQGTLNAQLSTLAGSATSNAGTVSGLNPGSSDSTSLLVGLDSSTTGPITGSALIDLQSVEPNCSGACTSALPAMIVNLSATVVNPANAVFELDSGLGTLSQSGTSFTLDLGTLTQGSAASSTLSLLNDVMGPADLLSGDFSSGALTDVTLAGFDPFLGLAAGASLDSLIVDVDTTSTGSFDNTVDVNGTASYPGASYAPYADDLSLTIEGNIIGNGGNGNGGTGPTDNVPEPGSLALLIGCTGMLVGFAIRRRRRIGAERRA